MAVRNYTLGRGRIFFGRFEGTGEVPRPFRYLGNTPELNLTIETENLDHVSSESGVREVDDSVALDVTRSGTMICDDIQLKNLALFFFGEEGKVTATAATGVTETFVDPQIDEVFQLGLSDADRVGVRNIDFTSLTHSDNTALTVNTDFRIDEVNGLIEMLKTPPAGTYTATYSRIASTYDRVISGSQPVQGAMRFVEDNPKGINNFWVMPKVTLRPNGEISLKGDEWRQIPFSLDVQKPSVGEAIYINGVPANTG